MLQTLLMLWTEEESWGPGCLDCCSLEFEDDEMVCVRFMLQRDWSGAQGECLWFWFISWVAKVLS